ncbi:MAG: rhomboid family intramembrane serine protease [Chloroflexi bacterium]|nr:rhomboid family intramembrane serine protease [Chloroflexota bacterium]
MYQRVPRPQDQGSVIDRIIASQTPATFALIGINVVVWLLLEVTGGSENIENLLRFGAKFGPKIAEGQYWRLFTPMFLHIGFLHLLTNTFGLLIFGRIVERYFGSINFTLIYLLAGVFGNIFSYAILSAGVGAGASGAVFGIVSAYAAFLYKNRVLAGPMARSSLGGLALIVGANLLFGFAVAGIDNWAHIGGLVSGFIIAFRLVPTVSFQSREMLPGLSGGVVMPILSPPPKTARLEVILISLLTIVVTIWIIGKAYPLGA